jgi:serine-type D-Ala-D-Ala carboxypeptidase/endopeptidase (penicillin-binding protein 4)
MKYSVFFLLICGVLNSAAQSVPASLDKAISTLQNDPQFIHGTLSMYVVESNSGKVVFEKNAQTGMAPASVQKIITSVSAFELLGKDFRYKTYIGFDSTDKNGQPQGNLVISGTGDPTFGSWRWKQTSDDRNLGSISSALKRAGKDDVGRICIDDLFFSYNPIPDGWIWQDIGNYYGAGARGFNWNENQFDIVLSSPATIGDKTKIVSSNPDLTRSITNLVTASSKESGDNAYIYSTPYNDDIFVTGTIPVNERSFTISGSLPDPATSFGLKLSAFLTSKNIKLSEWRPLSFSEALRENLAVRPAKIQIDSILSPTLDSMNYWFLKKSVNLYGEAFLKTMAAQKAPVRTTEAGVSVLRDFWEKRGIDRGSLKLQDGSGLSPANRITAEALVKVLRFAKDAKWFPSFYNALPEMNGIKMKDGYISGVRSYTGYVKSRNGVEYTFAFLVNNFDGNPGTVREKMWRVLDILK